MSVANLADDGKDMMVLIDGIVSFFRNILIAKNLNDPRKIIRVRDMDRYVAIANAFSNSEILNIIKILSETKARSRYITNKRTMLEAALLEIVASKQDDILNRVENLERMLSSGDLSGLKAPKREKFEFNFSKKENPAAVEKPLAKEVVSEIIDDKVSNESKENVEKEIENEIPKDIPEVPVDDQSDMSAIEKSQEDAAETDINAVETEETMETKADIDYSDNELQGIFNRAISILKERSERIISGMLVMGRLDSFENNVATIAFEEQGRSFYTTLNNHESIEKIESVLKELTNDNISVKFVVKSNSNVDSIKDRIENLFGKDSIK